MSVALVLKGMIWFDDDGLNKTKIKRAIKRTKTDGDELIIEFIYDGGGYTACLQNKKGNKYEGYYLYQGEKYQEKISCKVYSYENTMFVHGKWLEDNQDSVWYCELQIASREVI